MNNSALITNDAVVLGLLSITLGVIDGEVFRAASNLIALFVPTTLVLLTLAKLGHKPIILFLTGALGTYGAWICVQMMRLIAE